MVLISIAQSSIDWRQAIDRSTCQSGSKSQTPECRNLHLAHDPAPAVANPDHAWVLGGLLATTIVVRLKKNNLEEPLA